MGMSQNWVSWVAWRQPDGDTFRKTTMIRPWFLRLHHQQLKSTNHFLNMANPMIKFTMVKSYHITMVFLINIPSIISQFFLVVSWFFSASRCHRVHRLPPVHQPPMEWSQRTGMEWRFLGQKTPEICGENVMKTISFTQQIWLYYG